MSWEELREQKDAGALKGEMGFDMEGNTAGTHTKGVEEALYLIKTVHQAQAAR
jgi:hypothetical protein